MVYNSLKPNPILNRIGWNCIQYPTSQTVTSSTKCLSLYPLVHHRYHGTTFILILCPNHPTSCTVLTTLWLSSHAVSILPLLSLSNASNASLTGVPSLP